jgi:hypothetical protein
MRNLSIFHFFFSHKKGGSLLLRTHNTHTGENSHLSSRTRKRKKLPTHTLTHKKYKEKLPLPPSI